MFALLWCCSACVKVISDIGRRCTFYFHRYKATVYPCPEKLEERRDMLVNLGARIADLQIVSADFVKMIKQ